MSEFIRVCLDEVQSDRLASAMRDRSPSRTSFDDTCTSPDDRGSSLSIQLDKFTLFYLEKKERVVQGAVRPE